MRLIHLCNHAKATSRHSVYMCVSQGVPNRPHAFSVSFNLLSFTYLVSLCSQFCLTTHAVKKLQPGAENLTSSILLHRQYLGIFASPARLLSSLENSQHQVGQSLFLHTTLPLTWCTLSLRQSEKSLPLQVSHCSLPLVSQAQRFHHCH